MTVSMKLNLYGVDAIIWLKIMIWIHIVSPTASATPISRMLNQLNKTLTSCLIWKPWSWLNRACLDPKSERVSHFFSHPVANQFFSFTKNTITDQLRIMILQLRQAPGNSLSKAVTSVCRCNVSRGHHHQFNRFFFQRLWFDHTRNGRNLESL